MPVLDHLEPKSVFRFFEDLCAIPHGSRNTRAVSDWCVEFAKARGLEYHQDGANNVIIIREAAPGYEDAPPVILQGHLDMVCEQEPGCGKDMAREGLDLAVDGDFVHAKGTTLGGDDGIAVAMALAILDDPSIPHPRLEVVLTTEEEIGMLGAAALDPAPLRGRQLINLDSEEEGVFTVSCAGGSLTRCTLPVSREPFPGAALKVRVSGLVGGHSGAEIHKGRANADVLLGRLLRAMAAETELRLVSAAGGLKDNAIPVAAEAVAVTLDAVRAKAAAEALAAALKGEYQAADPGLTVEILPAETAETPMDADSTRRALCLLSCAPNGVQEMSHDIPGLVQTSLNLGILETGETALSAAFCVRSSVASQKELLHDRLRCLTETLGGAVDITGDYPAWEYRRDSALRERMVEVFREQYGHDPRIEAIHAGVECGLLCGKLPELDCVSVGPDLTEIHTPREKMSVFSVQRVWAFVLEVLRRSR
ncbi:MAG: aminoacyl-histidine dipeptidase [Oscillospiraceae bacterium]|nr:aminoacyl-histidine dipeptidase [Oscillospiraceae bacterium]